MPTHFLSTTGGGTLAVIGGALRNTGSGWGAISDTGHRPSGITSVATQPDHIEVQHAVGAARVVALQVTVDETYAAAGLRCGVSAGLALSRIYLYSGASSTPVAPATIAAATGNLWLQGLMET
ncbi:hypothetical protein ACWF94_06155 [Streptomyces sp. NPDC055078]